LRLKIDLTPLCGAHPQDPVTLLVDAEVLGDCGGGAGDGFDLIRGERVDFGREGFFWSPSVM
jgi:hypothetical protein